jgi:hypothetical protein
MPKIITRTVQFNLTYDGGDALEHCTDKIQLPFQAEESSLNLGSLDDILREPFIHLIKTFFDAYAGRYIVGYIMDDFCVCLNRMGLTKMSDFISRETHKEVGFKIPELNCHVIDSNLTFPLFTSNANPSQGYMGFTNRYIHNKIQQFLTMTNNNNNQSSPTSTVQSCMVLPYYLNNTIYGSLGETYADNKVSGRRIGKLGMPPMPSITIWKSPSWDELNDRHIVQPLRSNPSDQPLRSNPPNISKPQTWDELTKEIDRLMKNSQRNNDPSSFEPMKKIINDNPQLVMPPKPVTTEQESFDLFNSLRKENEKLKLRVSELEFQLGDAYEELDEYKGDDIKKENERLRDEINNLNALLDAYEYLDDYEGEDLPITDPSNPNFNDEWNGIPHYCDRENDQLIADLLEERDELKASTQALQRAIELIYQSRNATK